MTISKDDICINLQKQIDSQYKLLKAKINLIRSGPLHLLRKSATKIDPVTITPVPIDDFNNIKSSLQDKINNSIDMSIVDQAKHVLDCVGMDVSKDMGFEFKIDDITGTCQPPSMLSNIGNSINNSLKTAEENLSSSVDSLISPIESAAANAINKIKDIVEPDFIKKFVDSLQCIDNCPEISGPDLLDVEQILGKAGLNINGELDYGSSALSGYGITTDVQNHLTSLSDSISDVNTLISDTADNMLSNFL